MAPRRSPCRPDVSTQGVLLGLSLRVALSEGSLYCAPPLDSPASVDIDPVGSCRSTPLYPRFCPPPKFFDASRLRRRGVRRVRRVWPRETVDDTNYLLLLHHTEPPPVVLLYSSFPTSYPDTWHPWDLREPSYPGPPPPDPFGPSTQFHTPHLRGSLQVCQVTGGPRRQGQEGVRYPRTVHSTRR